MSEKLTSHEHPRHHESGVEHQASHEHARGHESANHKESHEQHRKHEQARKIGHHEARPSAEIAAPLLEKDRPVQEIATKQIKDETYTRTLRHIRTQLSPSDAIMSKVIHNPVVETVSEAVSQTVGRPSAITGGGLAAGVGLIIITVLAKRTGFELSGYEFLLLLLCGMALGVILEFLIRGLRRLLLSRR